jgi:hypothetical protein
MDDKSTPKRSARGLKLLATVLGSVWFFPVSCTTGTFVGNQIVAAADARDASKGDTMHSLFKVVAEPGEKGAAFRVLHWDEVQPYLAQAGAQPAPAPVSFRMSAASGSVHEWDSRFEYRVLEDSGSEQLIELVEAYDDGDNTIWSRYRATRNTIAPVSSRMFYFGYMFSAMVYAFIGALVLHGIGRLLRRRFAAPTA